MATGPFAPAGTGGTASAPLYPIGPVSGATRVPPPPTSNSSPTNGYNSPPTASNVGPGPSSTLQVNSNVGGVPPLDSFSTSPTLSSPDAFRNSLGGMPVIDMTSGNQTQIMNPTLPSLANSYSNNATPFGSGVYDPSQRAVETSAWARQPAELLRSIDQPIGAVPVPRYRGIDESVSPLGSPIPYVASAVQPAGGFPSTDSWQTVQPTQMKTSQTNVVQGGFDRTPTGQGAFTSPTTQSFSGASVPQVASPTLPWRSPTTAR